jgi:spore maturation protein CgeB
MAFLFTWRAAHVDRYRASGFDHVEHTPLAANVRRRAPRPSDDPNLGGEVVFVGSSLAAQVDDFHQRVVTDLAAFLGSRSQALTVTAQVLEAQDQDLSQWSIPQLLEEAAPGFLGARSTRALPHDPTLLLGEIAAHHKRLAWVCALGKHDTRAWGDEGWRAAERYGVHYMGSAGHDRQLTEIYSTGRIHLDIGRLYQSDIVTMRVFDVLAAGGFVLAEHSPDLAELFKMGTELISYRNASDLREKVSYYLSHPDEAAEIAGAGHRAVVQRHAIRGRIKEMLMRMHLAATPGDVR